MVNEIPPLTPADSTRVSANLETGEQRSVNYTQILEKTRQELQKALSKFRARGNNVPTDTIKNLEHLKDIENIKQESLEELKKLQTEMDSLAQKEIQRKEINFGLAE